MLLILCFGLGLVALWFGFDGLIAVFGGLVVWAGVCGLV